MSALDDLPPLREVIRRHDLSAKKSLGQNFLLDLNLTARIARAGGPLDGVTVVEIGPGPGGLTRALLASGARRVIAIERDSRAVAALDEIAAHYPGRLTVIPGDALERRRRALSRRRPGAHRRQPALQHRDGAAGALARRRAVAAVVRHDGADVPARGRRAHRRDARRQAVRPPRRARRLAHRGEDHVRRRALGLRAAAQGDLVGGAADPARRARCRAAARRSSASPRPPSASAARCCARACARSASILRRCSPPPASTARRAPKRSRSKVSSHSPMRSTRPLCVAGWRRQKEAPHDQAASPIARRLWRSFMRDRRRLPAAAGQRSVGAHRAVRRVPFRPARPGWLSSSSPPTRSSTSAPAARCRSPSATRSPAWSRPRARTPTIARGRKVAVYPWIGCGECPACRHGEENLCAAPRHLGIAVDGGYASHVVVPHPRYLLDYAPLSPSLAGALMCSGLTAYAALKRLADRAARGPFCWSASAASA